MPDFDPTRISPWLLRWVLAKFKLFKIMVSFLERFLVFPSAFFLSFLVVSKQKKIISSEVYQTWYFPENGFFYSRAIFLPCRRNTTVSNNFLIFFPLSSPSHAWMWIYPNLKNAVPENKHWLCQNLKLKASLLFVTSRVFHATLFSCLGFPVVNFWDQHSVSCTLQFFLQATVFIVGFRHSPSLF